MMTIKTKRSTSRRLAALLVGGVVAVSGGVAAPAADAAPICRQVVISGIDYGQACVGLDATTGESGTTVAPTVSFQCSQTLLRIGQIDSARCGVFPIGTSVRKTGFEPRLLTPGIYVDPATATVRVRYGLLGVLWVNGVPINVTIGETCVGDPAIC